MEQQWMTRTIGLLSILTAVVSVSACQVEIQAAAQGAVPVAQEGVQPAVQVVPVTVTMVEVDRRYEAYGFVFEQYADHDTYSRFSAHELEVLGEVIVAYAELAGGAERLNLLVNGPVRVRRDLQAAVSYTQAGRVIGLGQGAFDLAVTTAANYYTWGANNGDELAQIVFGHEIAHRWVDALRKRDGVDWGVKYGQNVWRGERPSTRETWDTPTEPGGDAPSPEEEAVTNMALFALGRGYRWTFLHDAPATARRQVMVDGWVYDVVVNSAE